VNRPIRKVAIALAVLFLALFVNLNVVQVGKGSDYRNDSRNQRVLLNEYSTPRGQIVVQGTAIAQSKKKSDELKYLRVYPDGPEYAPATGYYSFIYGTSGIEYAENSILSGDSSKLFTNKLTNILTGRSPRGGSVELTLNKAAQDAAYKAMKGGNGKLRRGAVVALDPRTGAILAMVSTPSYDPNKLSAHSVDDVQNAWQAYQKSKSDPMLNRALNQNYPAGSIFKIIDAAAALKHRVKPTDKVPAPRYFWPLDQKRTSACPANLAAACVQNFGAEECQPGSKTAALDFAFAKSCNTAFAALAVNRIGAVDLKAEAHAFGFDSAQLKVPLPVAQSTVGSSAVLNDDAALAQTSFGQRDVRITPIQAAMLSSAVANNGTLMKPYLVQRELRPNLSTLSSTQPQQLSQVIDPNLDQDLVDMMQKVVTSPEGTGGPANITDLPGVVVGGKTGTADVGTTSASNAKPDAWFTGFALANGTPKIAVAVIIENGGVAGNESAGGQAAGPVAKAVMEAYLKSAGVR
jgi:peptidoglycan glycosyltransferase